MKSLILASFMLLSVNAMAIDMSRTENYDEAYKELTDGSSIYVGGCSTHQDYEGKHFKVTKNLVPYFEPGYDAPETDTLNKIHVLDKELIAEAKDHLVVDSMSQVDDLTVDKIQSLTIKGLDLYRMDIGVGGGNGMILVFNKVKRGSKIEYALMSEVFDGDVEHCEDKVWLNKKK
jgi:hypothetical protein